MKAGQVVKVWFTLADPPKTKICLCICIEENLFFIISSQAYPFAPADSQIKIFKSELSCLEHDSYIDVSKAYAFDSKDIAKAELKGVYDLDVSARNKIKYKVQSQNYLPEKQKAKVLKNL